MKKAALLPIGKRGFLIAAIVLFMATFSGCRKGNDPKPEPETASIDLVTKSSWKFKKYEGGIPPGTGQTQYTWHETKSEVTMKVLTLTKSSDTGGSLKIDLVQSSANPDMPDQNYSLNGTFTLLAKQLVFDVGEEKIVLEVQSLTKDELIFVLNQDFVDLKGDSYARIRYTFTH